MTRHLAAALTVAALTFTTAPATATTRTLPDERTFCGRVVAGTDGCYTITRDTCTHPGKGKHRGHACIPRQHRWKAVR